LDADGEANRRQVEQEESEANLKRKREGVL
jgi:hypothetical protein